MNQFDWSVSHAYVIIHYILCAWICTQYGRCANLCAHNQEGEGLIVLGTKRQVHLFEVSTHTPEAIMGFHH